MARSHTRWNFHNVQFEIIDKIFGEQSSIVKSRLQCLQGTNFPWPQTTLSEYYKFCHYSILDGNYGIHGEYGMQNFKFTLKEFFITRWQDDLVYWCSYRIVPSKL